MEVLGSAVALMPAPLPALPNRIIAAVKASFLAVSISGSLNMPTDGMLEETFVNTYKLREITLIAQKAVGEDINYDITGNIMFESVDTIVTNQLTNIQSEQYNKNLLLDIYRNL
jgi:hypothetical protein